MANEILSTRFEVTLCEESPEKYKGVGSLVLKNRTHELSIDYNNNLFNVSEKDIVEVILYNEVVTDDDVPQDYEYVMIGKMYECNNDDGYKYLGSFGGLKLDIRCESEIAQLNDNCHVSLAMKKL